MAQLGRASYERVKINSSKSELLRLKFQDLKNVKKFGIR